MMWCHKKCQLRSFILHTCYSEFQRQLYTRTASGGYLLNNTLTVPGINQVLQYIGVPLISQFCRFDILYNFYWYYEYIDIHYIVVIDNTGEITSFIFRVDFPVQTPCPNRHNYGTHQLIKTFLQTELCDTSVHISTLFLNMSI